MKRVVWTAPARAELEGILGYISRDSRATGLRVIRKIKQAANAFREFPNGGRPGAMPGTREVIVPGLPYVIVYKQRGDAMLVVRVRHGAQLYPPGLDQSED